MATKSKVEEKPVEKEITLEEALATIKKLSAEMEAKEQELETLAADQEGWLIRTPAPSFDGQTFEVEFKDGLAFIKRSDVFQRFIPKNDKHTKGQTILPSNERMVKTLVDEFGYSAEYFPRERLPELKKIRADRIVERRQFEAELKANSPATQSKILPGFMQNRG